MAEADSGADAAAAARHVQIFVPSVDRYEQPISKGQQYWTDRFLELLAELFGGATAFPPSKGVWRADDGRLVHDETVIVFSYVRDEDLTATAAKRIEELLFDLGTQENQGEVGLYVDGRYRRYRQFLDYGKSEQERGRDQ